MPLSKQRSAKRSVEHVVDPAYCHRVGGATSGGTDHEVDVGR